MHMLSMQEELPAPDRPAVRDAGSCAAEQLLIKRCTTCHDTSPKFGAPMSLAQPGDLQKPSKSQPSMTVAAAVRERINATDNRRMPPASSSPLTSDELAAFNDWLDAGAVAEPACLVADTTQPVEPPKRAVDLECHRMTAHSRFDKDAPFTVGIATDAYYNFTFNAPWEGTRYVREIHALTDNSKVLHHWLLYRENGAVLDGAISSSSGAHPGAELVHGWAPGGEDLLLPDDVGMELPQTGFTLEFHYNSLDPAAVDSSGVEVCLARERPKNIAGISWLGTDAIAGFSASGTCSPFTGEPIRILGGTPHMHTAGTHMKVEILRQSGQKEILHDAPFDFNYQRAYSYSDRDLWLQPGDRIRTTCTYNRPSAFGESTGAEMCYFFTLHYPAGALSSPGAGQALHGFNSCGVL